MHEMAICESLIKIVEEKVKEGNIKKVININVKIGKLTNIVPDCLNFAFEILSKDSFLSGTKLIIEETPLIAYCEKCEKSFQKNDFIFICEECSSELSIKSGRELYIESMEVEDGNKNT